MQTVYINTRLQMYTKRHSPSVWYLLNTPNMYKHEYMYLHSYQSLESNMDYIQACRLTCMHNLFYNIRS